jgi:hypothetical protein
MFGLGDSESDLAACNAIISQLRRIVPCPSQGGQFRYRGLDLANLLRDGENDVASLGMGG